MIEWAWGWALLLLPLPLLWRYWGRKRPTVSTSALRVPVLEEFVPSSSNSDKTPWLSTLLFWLSWVLLVIAAARPLWVGDEVTLPQSGRDLMLAVDLSGSMEEKDFQLQRRLVNRLTATKFVASDFIDKRMGDRLGLVLFGDKAYLQAPLTFDRETVKTLLMESAIGLAGERTAIGDAIGLAIKHLKDSPEQSRVLILMTDGANTAGQVSPADAATVAAKHDLKIYTVGIGSEGQSLSRQFGFGAFSRGTELDETLLREIARKTGGRYFRARDTEEFARIYETLDRLEPIERDEQTWRPQEDLFRWPLLAALFCLMFHLGQRVLIEQRGL